MKKIYVTSYILVLLFLHVVAIAQEDELHLNIEKGGNVEFKVNSISQYKGGMEYENWTTLKIYSDTTWYLGVKATRDSFICNYPQPSLGLNVIKLQASDGGEDSFNGTLVQTEITLNEDLTHTTLVNAADSGFYKINITYRLDPLIGKHPGYYNQNLFLFDAVTRSPFW